MTTVYLVRHCESLGNIGNRMQGRTDCDISENGGRQLENLRERMAAIPIDVIYSSPLLRARKTAEAIRADRDIEICVVEELQEMSFGNWENRTWAELRAAYPNESGKWNIAPYDMHFENGEDFDMVEERTVAAIEAIVAKNPGKRIAIATHATPIRVYARYVLDADRDLKAVDWARNTSVSTFTYDAFGKATLVTYGDFSHQPEELIYHVKNPSASK